MDAPVTPENAIFVVFACRAGGCEVDRNELRDAAFGHRDAEQAVNARHRDRVVRDRNVRRRANVLLSQG